MKPEIYRFNPAGSRFRPVECQAELIAMMKDTPLVLRRDPSNEFDPNAIELRSDRTNAHLGFVPKHIAAELAPRLDSGETFTAVVANEIASQTKKLIEVRLATTP